MKNKHKKSIQSLRRSTRRVAPVHALVKNRRAVSAVVSNLILIAAVISIGMVALAYARSTSINYQTEYAQTINSDVNKIKESLTFEYAHYNTNQLTLYVINSGPVNVTVKSISINSSPVPSSSMYRMSDNQEIFNDVIAKGTEVKIVLNTVGMTHSGENSVKIISGSDSNFAYNFFV